MSILTLTGVSKSFGGQKVLDGLTMAVSEHSVYGFLGKNGAGKTTTMKLIAGFLRPDDGTITVCGKPVRFGSSPKSLSVGYLPDVPEFYPYMIFSYGSIHFIQSYGSIFVHCVFCFYTSVSI